MRIDKIIERNLLNEGISIEKDGYVFKEEIRWGGLSVYIIYKNNKQVGALPPNMKLIHVKDYINRGKYKQYIK